VKISQTAKQKSQEKNIQPYPHLAGAEEGIEQLAERLPHPRTEILKSTSLTAHRNQLPSPCKHQN